jgi:cytoskeleton protein RodZ
LPESLGMKLRTARETKGLTLEQLADLTRINASFLEAIENGRWDLLPGRVYLKTFIKSCAEALDLDVGELYKMIDGASGETPKAESIKEIKTVKAESVKAKKRSDYKLPIVAASILVVIVVGSFIIKFRMKQEIVEKKSVAAIHKIQKRGSIEWERPWERPAVNADFSQNHRFRLETTAPVWVRIIADGDTVFTGVMPADSGGTFIAQESFLVSVGKNDRVKAYLDGIKIPALGASVGPLRNYLISIEEKKDNNSYQN